MESDNLDINHVYIYVCVIAGEPEGSRRDCNTMEKQRGRR
jgi:hypothetical protein